MKRMLEGKQVGIIYHFTRAFSLEHQKNYPIQLQVIDKITNIITKGLVNFNREYISFSRNFFVKEGFEQAWGDLRISIDGNILSDMYSIKPFSDVEAGMRRTDEENEERIIWPKGKFLNISKSILGFDFVLFEYEYDDRRYKTVIRNLTNVFPSYTFRVVNTFKPYHRQDDITKQFLLI